MIDVDKLQAYLDKKGFSKSDVARITGVSPKTFSRWIYARTMPVDKAELLIQELEIENPSSVFFDGRFHCE